MREEYVKQGPKGAGRGITWDGPPGRRAESHVESSRGAAAGRSSTGRRSSSCRRSRSEEGRSEESRTE